MPGTQPPRIACWIVEHFTPEGCAEALKGDLLESYRAGRSRAWYWRQVISALVIAWIQSYVRHRFIILFATVWCTLSPAWALILRRLQNEHSLGAFIWRLPWPWSTLSGFVFWTLMALVFVWVGALVYILLVPSKLRDLNTRQIRRAIAMSFAGYASIVACLLALTIIIEPHNVGHVVDWRTLTLRAVITDIRIWTLPTRMPYLVGTACALWGFAPFTERQMKRPKLRARLEITGNR